MSEQLKTALHIAGIDTFKLQACYPLPDAQRNLSGRTHYCDDGTLRYFSARINSASDECGGLVYMIEESVSHPELGRVHRFVAFDVFGTVISDREEFHKTRKPCTKAKFAWLNGFDAEAHTIATLRKWADRQTREAQAVIAALDEVSP